MILTNLKKWFPFSAFSVCELSTGYHYSINKIPFMYASYVNNYITIAQYLNSNFNWNSSDNYINDLYNILI